MTDFFFFLSLQAKNDGGLIYADLDLDHLNAAKVTRSSVKVSKENTAVEYTTIDQVLTAKLKEETQQQCDGN